jgi:hypothetical protein
LAKTLAAAEAERAKLAAEIAQLEQQAAALDADTRQKAEKEKADRESKNVSDQAETLKGRIAELEKQTAEANTKATAEEQKAVDAKKAASEQRDLAVVPVAPVVSATPSPPNPSDAALTPQIRGELRRLGCYVGADADWGGAEMKRAVAKYALSAKLGSSPDIPSAALLVDLKSRHDRLCPPDCSAREVDVGGRCVVKNCGHGEILSRAGACVARPIPHEEANRAQPQPVVRAPAKGGHCFVFNGNNYCE